jgi:hypothetical protein
MKLQPLQTFALPYPFPPGRVWVAIKGGVVMNMVYMTHQPVDMSFQNFRQRSRADLAREGAVWTGEVKEGRFVPQFESRDVRHTGEMNTAREVRV